VEGATKRNETFANGGLGSTGHTTTSWGQEEVESPNVPVTEKTATVAAWARRDDEIKRLIRQKAQNKDTLLSSCNIRAKQLPREVRVKGLTGG